MSDDIWPVERVGKNRKSRNRLSVRNSRNLRNEDFRVEPHGCRPIGCSSSKLQSLCVSVDPSGVMHRDFDPWNDAYLC